MVTNVALPLPTELHRSHAYTDWVRAHDPAAEAVAVALLEDVWAGLNRAREKPGRFLEAMEARARRLPPAHLPWFWDTVAHRLCGTSDRYAGRAYALARKAEQEHTLPVDPAWRTGNVLLLAARGALPAKELSEHQRWLARTWDPTGAHEEYLRVLTAWATSPGELPADLARRVRASARAAGLDTAEDARVLARIMGGARGRAVPDALLDAVAGLLAAHPLEDAAYAPLVDLFPESRGDASAWLRLLLRSGAADAVVAGRVAPEGGVAAWLGRYTRMYGHGRRGGGVFRQPMPQELFALVARFAPLLRAAGTPVRIHEDRYRYPGLDADLLDACLAEGIAVEDPGDAVRLEFWGERSRRDLRALAADPVFGRRLEGTVHAGLRGGGTAITRLPENAGIAAEVHARVEALLAEARGGGVAAADEAVDELAALLDRPTATALEGVEEALAAVDLVGPLGRALRAGLPEELGWPALEEAVTEFGPGGVRGVTSTWPVLTVYGADRAVAVDHGGRRGACAFRVPEGATLHVVHFVGGSFLVSWTDEERGSYGTRAFWADRPQDVFTPERWGGLRPFDGIIDGAFGFQFATPDGGGRHDGSRVLRPGGREGVDCRELQMSDGTRFWSARVYGDDWERVDPVTGERGGKRELPAFHGTGDVPPDHALHSDALTLAVLPEGAPASPLGQDGRLVGCRVLHRTAYAGPSPTDFLLEGVDGRRARFRARQPGRHPWGVLRMPAGGEDAVLVQPDDVRVYAVEDGSLLWEAHGFPAGARNRRRKPSGHAVGPLPPPAFWHFLTPRDETSSKALRAVGDDAARALLHAARDRSGEGAAEAVRAEVARVLPEVTEPRVVAGAVRATLLAADVLRRREELSRRVGVMRSGPVVELPEAVPDTVLAPALYGLLPALRPFEAHVARPQPATLTAVAADGRHLRGEIDDETRRLALPAEPVEWAALAGRIDAVAWRAVAGTTPEAERRALAALLQVWSRQPFAERGGRWRTGRAPTEAVAACRAAGGVPASGAERGGTARFLQREDDPAPSGAAETVTFTVEGDDAGRLPRLLELLDRYGPPAVPPGAVDVFAWRTGVRRTVAALVLGGLPRRERHDDDHRMLRGKPYRATKAVIDEYVSLWHRLGQRGRLAVLAAGVPEDPAELWADGGMAAAAGRMAEVWARLLGTAEYVDEELAGALEEGLGLGAEWSRGLATGELPEGVVGFSGAGCVLAAGRRGGLQVHEATADGTPGTWLTTSRLPDERLVALVVWALCERPVGDPAVAGATALHGRLRRLLDDPRTLVPLHGWRRFAEAMAADPAVPAYAGAVLPCAQPLLDDTVATTGVYDDGVFVVAAPGGDAFLRTAALGDPERVEHALRRCDGLGLTWVVERVGWMREVRDGGVARMVARAAATPVPPGGYELNPALSVPDLVATAAADLGVGGDAAALYLQLLTLARPTDRNVRRWNDWTPARHRAAQEELAAAGAVETGRRARAGRTAFVPGPWTDLRAPELPLETAKLASYGASVSPRLSVPWLRLLPVAPPHELFARAWAARP
ncbi:MULTISPECIES: hypothetical protein [Streptomyces]|uniref:DNA-binding protein n=2 Tax=Streptomyces TaxID=1883 RepID=A0A100YAA0_9ACTN|nr:MULTISPECIES: hypothetical protein [Streptomyces]KUH40531.1 hypothetical protein ATE80_01170 [Streptomyces kanasensis]UUS33698.1 hypothetical protein NRO40_24645 [Streptomyces changanensis]